tara:strand:+ start:373 stop:870 length:498 start_codon:yes stop_codon:yes gene_type:complete
MTQDLPAQKHNTSAPPAPAKRRVSAKVRKALEIRVREGATWLRAAELAGLSEAGIHKARKQPHVIDLFERLKTEYVQQLEQLEGVHKARALEVARELLDQEENKQVRARMVEFLRGESKQPVVSVAINQQFNGDYAFAPRGARVVEIVQPDEQSVKQEQESTEDQ